MSTIQCLIIDDDPFMRDLLSDKLKLCGDIEILALASDGSSGIEKIKAHHPELVFLDVEMTDMTGFEMLDQLDSIDFKTIFVTSYGHYAIKAIRANALDYLLKPVDLQELKVAIQRFVNTRDSPKPIKEALENLKKPPSEQRLVLKTQEGEFAIDIPRIMAIQGDRNYSDLKLTDGSHLLVAKTLADLEELLEDKGFFRIHKSSLVNGQHIDQVKGHFLTLSNDVKFLIARRRKEAFTAWWSKLNDED